MFMGHYSSALLAKRLAPALPLPLYFLAAQTIDIFWGLFVLLGIEKLRIVPDITASNSLDLYFMPFSHSIPAALVWSTIAFILFWVLAKNMPRRLTVALIIAAVVGSHWVFDFIVHRPDLPVLYDGVKVGLSFWDYRLPALLLELALLGGAFWFSLKAAGENHWRYGVLVGVMGVIQILSLVLPASSSGTVVTLQLMASYLVVTALAFWADRSRRAAQAST